MRKIKAEVVTGLPGKSVTITEGKEPRELTFIVPFKLFERWKVASLDWEEKGTRSVGKAAAGAVVGGLLTGGLGAIVGAAIGGRKKDMSTATIIL